MPSNRKTSAKRKSTRGKSSRRGRGESRGLFGRFGRLLYWCFVLAIWGGIAAAGVTVYYGAKMPAATTWAIPDRAPNIKIVSVDGKLIANRGMSGGEAVGLRGNDFAQTVRGNGGNNSVYGGGGNDTLIGGLGRDAMKGEAGNDVFDFNTAAETGINANTRDKIADFTHGSDRIDLSTIDANGALAGDAFNYIGVAGFNHVAGELRYVQVDNVVNNALDETIIEADVNGNGIADFQIALTGLIGLSAGDFVV